MSSPKSSMKPTHSIQPVRSAKDLEAFVGLPYRLYRDDPNFVPQLRTPELEQFDPEKNPAYDSCEAQLFIALQGKKVIGRVAAIISQGLIEKEQKQIGRFGWFECEDDREVATSLIRAAEGWLAERGITEVVGPAGFSDVDPAGFLIEGFDELPTISGSYNPPWYNDLIIDLGYEKDVDYIEYRIVLVDPLPERIVRMAAVLKKRSHVRVVTEKSRKTLAKKWGRKVFNTLNESYEELHGTTSLSDRQIEYYIKLYLGHVDPEFVKIAVDGDRVVGFLIAMPSLSRAFQKAQGRLFPFGYLHLLLALRKSKVLDFYLAGVLPEYQGKGVDLLMSYEMGASAVARGMEFGESNRELETNTKVQALWKFHEKRLHRRSRVYRRRLVAGE